MAPRRAHAGLVVLGLWGWLATPGTARADTFLDIQKAIGQAGKDFRESRPAAALKHLTNAAELIKSFTPGARDYLREAYQWIFDYNEPTPALKAIDKALAKDPKAAEAYYLRGYVAKSLGDKKAALDNLKKAFALKKDSPEPFDKSWPLNATNDLWGLLYQHQAGYRDIELAASEFQLLAEQEPENASFLYLLGVAHVLRRSYEQATEVFGRAVELRPGDWRTHLQLMSATRQFAGVKGAIQRYEELLKKHPAELAVQMALAKLYLEDGQKELLKPLLLQAKRNKALLDLKNINNLDVLSLRIELAEAFAKAEQYQDAVAQFARVLAGLPNNWQVGSKINLMISYAKALVRAGKLDDGIRLLNDALTLHRSAFPQTQQPLDILFEIGNAHRLAKRETNAELYFNTYLQALREGTVTTVKSPDEVKLVETLGEIYLKDRHYGKAAEVFQQALELVKVLREQDRIQYPRSGVQLKLARAFDGQGEWEKGVPVARELLDDKLHGRKARRLLARAYLKLGQFDRAIEQLNQVKDTPEWDRAAMLMMAEAHLAESPGDALKYIEEADRKQGADEELTLLHAKVLAGLERSAEAAALYQKILKSRRNSYDAWKGMGDLEMQLAKAAQGEERKKYLTAAAQHFKEARNVRRSDPEVLGKLSQAERELALTDADLQAQSDRLRLILYTGGLVLAALLPITFMIYFYRRQWAMRCFREVCDLERELIQLIRGRVQSHFDGVWERLADEPFRGRVDFRALRNRAEKEGTKDVLGVANFGHLVGIIDAGWEALGLRDLCAPEMADPKEVIIANLSYIGSCRVCLAHVGKLEELTARHVSSGRMTEATLKTHLSKHLHRQVKTSLHIIRAKFNVTPEVADLPVLAPVTSNAESITRSTSGDPLA